MLPPVEIPSACPPVSADLIDGCAVAPVIRFAALPVVSTARGHATVALAIEPTFMDGPTQLDADAIAFDRMPWPMLSRLEETLLRRAVAVAELSLEEEERETILINVASTSLEDRRFVARLAQVLELPMEEQPLLLTVVRGGVEALTAIDRLPRHWRARLGLRLTAPLVDDQALERCIEADLGVIEIDASLLEGEGREAERARHLAQAMIATNTPVVISGMQDRSPLRQLPVHPALFARGPAFDQMEPAAA
jgi:hypothetical protein